MNLLKPVDGRTTVRLAEIDPGDTGKTTKGAAARSLVKLGEQLSELQELQYGAQETPVLIVLQGLDTAGKDGTIRHVMGFMNPQSCRVSAFKVPTPEEAAHDFLWRVHAEAPSKGFTTIFNRSHYEDVLVVRVHNLVPEKVWRHRYEQINQFESLLASSGTVILKFFLHISYEEQEKRLKAREQDPIKAWKLSPDDWKERERWKDYQAAYEDAINQCGKPDAPWFVVPADHKWFRDVAIAQTIVNTLEPRRKGWMEKLKDIGAQELKLLRQQNR